MKPVEFKATAAPALINVPSLTYLMTDGKGDPDGEVYRTAVEGLYQASYAVRAALKPVTTYTVGTLQGRWHGVGLDPDRSSWRWTMMIAQPPEATADVVAAAFAAVKKPRPGLDLVRREVFAEGECAQILHVGPYADEKPAHDRLMAFIAAEGRVVSGSHHEIYLSDPRRVAPERMRTILRYPVASGATAT
ncbi:GyrI-like domain-containing protein [Phytomonospora endophytica]|uniref:GyrI-like small molecule binding domain-containing protein n=1 Tax=Phytomonospora endophytica TaxID=714109 RepID=A0A841G2C0_9ACTN|nr:GyrI-like domain-containing protein [Phytomonospora endophytica]MBB6038290.1 hypothetical protein [Phytomonospora endophytica]GIG64219.1 hypothetical protein Pen01_05140 [Phytomonospora endophytica]